MRSSHSKYYDKKMPEINFGHTNQPKINVPLTTVKFKNDGIIQIGDNFFNKEKTLNL